MCNAVVPAMMTSIENQTQVAPMSSSKRPVRGSKLVDGATALELRRTPRPAAPRDKRCARPLVAEDFTCPPTIRTRPDTASSPPSSAVPVVMVPAAPMSPPVASCPSPVTSPRIKLDLSWITAAFVALSVTGALAIPLELLRQHG